MYSNVLYYNIRPALMRVPHLLYKLVQRDKKLIQDSSEWPLDWLLIINWLSYVESYQIWYQNKLSWKVMFIVYFESPIPH